MKYSTAFIVWLQFAIQCLFLTPLTSASASFDQGTTAVVGHVVTDETDNKQKIENRSSVSLASSIKTSVLEYLLISNSNDFLSLIVHEWGHVLGAYGLFQRESSADFQIHIGQVPFLNLPKLISFAKMHIYLGPVSFSGYTIFSGGWDMSDTQKKKYLFASGPVLQIVYQYLLLYLVCYKVLQNDQEPDLSISAVHRAMLSPFEFISKAKNLSLDTKRRTIIFVSVIASNLLWAFSYGFLPLTGTFGDGDRIWDAVKRANSEIFYAVQDTNIIITLMSWCVLNYKTIKKIVEIEKLRIRESQLEQMPKPSVV